MKKIAIALIIVGILIAANPVYKEVYRWYWEQKLLDEFYKGENLVLDDTGRDQNGILTGEGNGSIIPVDNALPKKANTDKTTSSENGIIGLVQIAKINLKLPVLQGTSTDILDRAGGHIRESDMPGKVGNCAIAAHRSYTYGRFFNRLNEVGIGDKITVKVASETFSYIVYEKVIVLPEDTTVLKTEKDQTILTLITCDPMKNPTHRLILHAKLIKL